MWAGKTLGAIGPLLLLLTAGCTISIQPWSKPAAPAGNVPLDVNGQPLPYNPLMPGGPTGGPPKSLYPPPQMFGNNEALNSLQMKLAEAEDRLNTIQPALFQLKKEKGKLEVQSNELAGEIQNTLTQIKHLRQELKQWKGEAEEMSGRIQKLEENRATMKLLLDRVEMYLMNDREAKVFGPKLK